MLRDTLLPVVSYADRARPWDAFDPPRRHFGDRSVTDVFSISRLVLLLGVVTGVIFYPAPIYNT